MSGTKKLSILLQGIIKENPVLILVLGTCPTLATTSSVISALSMGIAATFVLVGSNAVISALRNVIPDTVRIPCYIVIIAGFVTALQMLLQAYLPSIYDMLGVYLALIVVNCIILGRAEMYARKNSVVDSALDGLGMGLGFLFALLVMSTIREVIGAGSFAGIAIPFVENYKIPILTQAPGGYLVFGIVIATMNKLTSKRGGVKRKSFSCEGCPSAEGCSGGCNAEKGEEEADV
ncbi:MAG: electron transport complex subunit E [Ruminococcaceae bacterium]|nr:electron transport complex subunit E [Oscillospiraceae bacterium]